MSPVLYLVAAAPDEDAAARLRAAGFGVVAPWEGLAGRPPAFGDLEDDLEALLACDGVALADGWERAVSCRIDATAARIGGVPTATIGEWVSEPQKAVQAHELQTTS